MIERFEILGTRLDIVTEDEAAAFLFDRITSDADRKTAPPALMVTPNPVIIMDAYGGNERLSRCLSAADLSLTDGSGVRRAARKKGVVLRERASGVGCAEKLIAMLASARRSIYIAGGKPGVAEEAAAALSACYPGLVIAGTCDGYFPEEESEKVANEIAATGADFVAVCMGSPKQEYFLCEYLAKTRGVGAAAGLGGCADVWSGRVKRAPKWISSAGVEWLWRMILQPKRVARIPALIKFAWLTRKVGSCTSRRDMNSF